MRIHWLSFTSVLPLALAACAMDEIGRANTGPPRYVAIRTDGQSFANSPALKQQYEVDQAICMGERQKASLSGVALSSSTIGGILDGISREHSADVVLNGCMAQRGYITVPESEAAARLALFREAQQARGATPAPIVTGSTSARVTN